MNIAFKRGAFASSIVMIFMPSAYAGAWNQGEGHGQVIATTLYSIAGVSYDDQGEDVLNVDYQKFETTAYIEHGLTERLTVIANPSFQNIDLIDSGGTQSYQGVGPTEIGLQWRLKKTDFSVLSVRGSIKIGSDGENIPDAVIGDGGTDYEMRALWGRGFSFPSGPAFIEGQAAYRYRGGAAPNERRFDISAGMDINSHVQLMAQSFYIQADGAQFPLRDYQSLKLQGSAVLRRAGGRAYQMGAFQTVRGRDIIKERGVFISVWTAY